VANRSTRVRNPITPMITDRRTAILCGAMGLVLDGRALVDARGMMMCSCGK
jgi:hypothetical protein